MKDSLTIEPSPAGHVNQGRKELKDEQLFARLIGAAVLLALAVIVLPFVLDGSGSQREYEYAETLPSEPPRPTGVESSFSSRQTPVIEDKSASFTSEPVLGAVTRSSVQKVSVPPITPTVELRPSQTNRSVSVNASDLPDAVATASEGGQGLRNPVQTTLLDSVSLKAGWNIQVASFVRDTNAIKLINRLRGQNLPAYANRVTGSQRTLIRVLVGPYGNQVDALALQNDIDRDYRVESLMVRGR